MLLPLDTLLKFNQQPFLLSHHSLHLALPLLLLLGLPLLSHLQVLFKFPDLEHQLN